MKCPSDEDEDIRRKFKAVPTCSFWDLRKPHFNPDTPNIFRKYSHVNHRNQAHSSVASSTSLIASHPALSIFLSHLKEKLIEENAQGDIVSRTHVLYLNLGILFIILGYYLQYPHKVSGHPKKAYTKTAFSLGRHGYNFKAILMIFVLRVLISRKEKLIFCDFFVHGLGSEKTFQ